MNKREILCGRIVRPGRPRVWCLQGIEDGIVIWGRPSWSKQRCLSEYREDAEKLGRPVTAETHRMITFADPFRVSAWAEEIGWWIEKGQEPGR